MKVTDNSNSDAVVIDPNKMQKQKLKKATQEFEAYFLQSLLKSMRKTVPQTEKKQAGAGIYSDMFDESLAKTMSESNQFGIGNILYKTLEKAAFGVQSKHPIIAELPKKTGNDKK